MEDVILDGEVKLDLDLYGQLFPLRQSAPSVAQKHHSRNPRSRGNPTPNPTWILDSRFSSKTVKTLKNNNNNNKNATLTLLPYPPHTADNRPAPLHTPQIHGNIALPIPIPTHPPHARRPDSSSDKSSSNRPLHPPPPSIPHLSHPPGNIQPSAPGVPGCAACAAIAVSGARGPVSDEGCLLENGDYEAQEAEFGGEEDGES